MNTQNHPILTVYCGDQLHFKGEKDILENQIKYWGIKGIHYHQLLRAGENTLNLKLACELYKTIIKNGEFDLNDWLTRYAEVMTTLVTRYIC